MSISRKGRLHIASPDGLAYNTTVTQEDGTPLNMPVMALHLDVLAGSAGVATIKCFLATFDFLTDAEIELHTGEMRRRELVLQRAAEYLGTLPANEDRDSILAEIAPLLALPPGEYVTVAQQQADEADFDASTSVALTTSDALSMLGES